MKKLLLTILTVLSIAVFTSPVGATTPVLDLSNKQALKSTPLVLSVENSRYQHRQAYLYDNYYYESPYYRGYYGYYDSYYGYGPTYYNPYYYPGAGFSINLGF